MSIQPAKKLPSKSTLPLTPAVSHPTISSVKASEASKTPVLKKDGTPRQPKGPALTWNKARDKALYRAIKEGVTTRQGLVAALSAHPAFSGVDPDAIDVVKVSNRLLKIRKLAEEQGRAGIVAVLDTMTTVRRRGVDLDALDALEEDEEEDEEAV